MGWASELEVDAKGKDRQGAAALVEARVENSLYVSRYKDAAQGKCCVVGLEDGLPPIPERAVAEKKARATQGQVVAVTRGEAIRHEGQTDLVPRPPPAASTNVEAKSDRVI